VTSNLSVTANFNSNGTGGGSTLHIDDAATTASGYCGADGSRQNTYTGADGGYYINLSNSTGKGVNYSVSVPAAGTYSFVWRYSNGGATVSTTARLLVNGSVAVASVSFPKTSSWTTWNTTAAVTATLAAGVNTIRIETLSSTEFAVIDWLEVTGTSPTAATCSSSAREAAPKIAYTATKVYPNPATNTAMVSFYNEKADRVQIRIYGTNGQLLKTVVDKEFPAGSNQLTVDVSSLPQSLYLIKVENSAGSNTLKLIKQ
jgi:hypothetical protein